MTVRALVFFITVFPAVLWAQSARETLSVAAMDYAGLPLEGVAFSVFDEAGQNLSQGITDEYGQFSYDLDHPSSMAVVLLNDPRYVAVEEQRLSEPGLRRLPFRVFSDDPAGMSEEERAAYSLAWAEMIVNRRDVINGNVAVGMSSSFINPDQVAAFLTGSRREEIGRASCRERVSFTV